jgi:transposase InsO family protein
MDACVQPPLPATVPMTLPMPRKGIVAALRRSTAPRQYCHADTIPLTPNWQKAKHVLILVDDFTRQCFVKLLKDKTQFHIAEALDEHLSQQKPLSTGVKGVNFYVRNTVLRSDRGSEFINASVLDVCGRHGCVPEYSCPGQLGKYQNGVVERRIKEIGRMGRAMMFTAEAPDLANAYCLLQAVDILNMLPSTANPADSLSNVTGFSPYLLYYNSAPPLEQIYAFGSFCTVHLDDDHIDSSRPNVRAATCIYLCRAHHCHSQGHIVWEYRSNGKGRKLIVPEISRHIWNYFPMRSGSDKHLSNSLTFVPPEVCDSCLPPSADISIPPSCPVLYMDAATDPMCPSFPDSHVIMDSGEQRSISESPSTQPQSAYKTRQFDRMSKNIGAKVRRVFFINGTSGPLDFFEGTVRSITSANKYDIVYDDNDSEEMSEREFSHFSLPPKAQARAHVARLGGDQWLKELSSCNCAEGHCYHPWAKHTPHFNPSVSPSDGKMVVAKSGIRKSDTSEGKMKYPSREPPVIPEYYAACHFPETMPDVVDTNNPIQGMLSHAAMMSSRKKAQRLSAYEADPITVDDCIK